MVLIQQLQHACGVMLAWSWTSTLLEAQALPNIPAAPCIACVSMANLPTGTCGFNNVRLPLPNDTC